MKSKKGALDISINSIVVIIFAITMLGLGLAFIRGTFGSIGEKVTDVISSADLEKKPSAAEPLTISTNRMEMKRGETKLIQVGYFNFEDTKKSVAASVSCDIPNDVTGTERNAEKRKFLTISKPAPREVKSTDSVGWGVSIGSSKNAMSGTYSCSVIAAAGSICATDSNDAQCTTKYQDFFVIIQ